jgi:hypothetical protein
MGAPPLTVEELKQVVAQTNGGRITAQTIRKAAHTIKREGKRPRNKKQQQILALQEEKDQLRKQAELVSAQKTRQLSLVIAKLVRQSNFFLLLKGLLSLDTHGHTSTTSTAKMLFLRAMKSPR